MPPDSMADSWAGVMRRARTIWTISRFSASVFCASRSFSFSCCSAIFSRVLAISWSMRSILFLAIVKSLHSISLFPSVVAPQTFDGFEMGHRVFFDGKRPTVQVGVLPFQGFDFLALHAGPEEAGRFAGQRQTRLLDCPDTIVPRPVPILDQRVAVLIFFVRLIEFSGMHIPFPLPGIVTDKPCDPVPGLPHSAAQRVVVTELFLRPDLVLLRTPLKPVSNG